MAIGTAMAQRRTGDGITIVQGGDAGTAEGDFASCRGVVEPARRGACRSSSS
jgi:TPP-dependent pyruvate/acetoin dehydrogenase alpha subunit